jgi:HaeIII restriction endonuclease.
MSKESNNLGRAYEYACIIQLEKSISNIRKVEIVKNSSLLASEKAWNNVDASYHEIFMISANAAVETLFEIEPLILEDDGDILELMLQRDTEGETGDVRDCVILRKGIEWEIGLSIKHNHFAVKHSRLAKGLDFGERWFGLPCSQEYWNEIKPVFSYLETEKSKKAKWRDLPNKEADVYVPLLSAFLSEIRRSYDKHKQLPTKMVEYLLGSYDFYKVISVDSKRVTQIQPYNLHGTLNKSSKKQKAKIIIPAIDLPTRIVSAEFKPKSSTTVELYFDEGWQFSFRLHNASTLVETSLKFDVQIKGMPATIMVLECKWN